MDGGYYLVGCSRQIQPIFDGIAWSGPNVLRDTVRALPVETRLALLPPWYDIDMLEDCRMLYGHLLAQARAGVKLNDGLTALMESMESSEWLTD
jgi:glycosyltransferase A (GT-A) superfamily protein (DUF2064 family)